MKRITQLLIAMLFCSGVWAQCPTGDITFSSQAEIDDFVSNFSTCDTIFGRLLIFGGGNSFDLSGLSFITTITGSLSLHEAYDLTGLESITYIGGNLEFVFHHTNVDAFDHEMYIGGDIIIEANPVGTCAVQAFCDFVEMGGTIIENYDDYNVPYNLCLINIQNNCTDSSNCPTGDVEIVGQGAADNFGTTFPDCTVIEGDLIFRNNAIDVTQGFAHIERINGNLLVQDGAEVSGMFTNLDTIMGKIIAFEGPNERSNLEVSFPALKYIEGDVEVLGGIEAGARINSSFPVLERMNKGFYVCGEIANLEFGDNFPVLKYIGGDMYNGVGYGTPLSGLNALDTLAGDLIFSAVCGGATGVNFTINEINQLKYIGGDFRITGFHDFNLNGTNQLNIIAGDLIILTSTPESIINLDGLSQVTSIGGSLVIQGTSITDLSALSNLTSIGENIRLVYNVNLNSLAALVDINNIGGEIFISYHDMLTSLNGLENIDPSSITNLTLTNNLSLSVCNQESICNYLENDGTATISNNASGCNTQTEIEDACDALPIEQLDPLRIYLNNKTAILTWRTATETNNEGFEIQRSKDGINWIRIGWQAGQGNSLTPHSYTYIDENPFLGTSYYRFKQVDTNGDFKYSNVVTLQYTRPGVTIFPNPNTGIFNIEATAQGTYKILNTSGQIIQTGNMKNDLSIDMSDQAQGVYFMSINIDNELIVKRIIKM